MEDEKLRSKPLAHIIREPHGEFERVTLDDTDAEMAEAEGKTVTMNATAQELTEELAGLPAEQFMDDKTWSAIAPSLKTLADDRESQPNPYDRQPAMIPLTAPDLPGEMITARLSALMRIYDPELDLGTYVELQEFWFARNQNRPVSQALFSNEAWASRWEEIYNEDADHLTRKIDQIRESRAGNVFERAAFGDSAPGSQRQDVLGRLAEEEIKYAMANYCENEDSCFQEPGPG